jgi:hypothetical protein
VIPFVEDTVATDLRDSEWPCPRSGLLLEDLEGGGTAGEVECGVVATFGRERRDKEDGGSATTEE